MDVSKQKAGAKGKKPKVSKASKGSKVKKPKGAKGSKSKSKKKGLSCCKREKKDDKQSKSKVTKKQPKPVKPLAPVPNEQLGDIVLVKDKGKVKPKAPIPAPPTPPQIPLPSVPAQGAQGALAPGALGATSIPSVPSAPVLAKASKSKETDKEIKLESKEKDTKKEDVKKEEMKKKQSKEELGDSAPGGDEKKEKWLRVAKRFVEEDGMASGDFQKVAGYIPAHVTKSQFSQNMPKNRFADVVCLDHSRVHLEDDDYIHASWVEVDQGRRAILTQMPLTNTAADFWQMVIEQRVKCILLLVTDKEYDKTGGDFVFPQNQDFLHFDERSIRVGEFKQLEIMKGWNLRVLSVTNGAYKSFLHVHHYKMWPHNSMPLGGVKQIWQLQSVLRKYSNPPVYMSVSGCGRAGSYALFEAAHASLHSDNNLFDMIKCLENVRNGRCHSVQTLNQFSFIYSLLAEHILGNGFCKLAKKGTEDEEETIQTILRNLTIPA